jgi:hypothetical protein
MSRRSRMSLLNKSADPSKLRRDKLFKSKQNEQILAQKKEKLLRDKRDGAYWLWISLGSSALSAIGLSIIGFFLALHPLELPGQPRVISAFAHLVVIVTCGWYYSLHHSPEYTFHDVYGKRLQERDLPPDLFFLFLITGGMRYILIDGAYYLESKELIFGPVFDILRRKVNPKKVTSFDTVGFAQS